MKAPLGLLIEGSFEETMKELKKIIEKERPSKLVAVGDVVSSNMIECGIFPHVFIVDNRVMREPIAPIQANSSETIYVKNPAGGLTEEAMGGVKRALDKRGQLIRVMVDGEEDLLTLAAVTYAPENSLIVYGQPHKGVAVVAATKKKKDEVKKILQAMISSA